MNRLQQKTQSAERRKLRVRKSTAPREAKIRLSVYISNRNVIAQLIDDTKHTTLAYVTSESAKSDVTSMTDKAVWVGASIAQKAKKAKVTTVFFDRGSKLYHGRIKALADEARKGGLEF